MAKLVFEMNQSLDGYVDHMAFAPSRAASAIRDIEAHSSGRVGIDRQRPAVREHLAEADVELVQQKQQAWRLHELLHRGQQMHARPTGRQASRVRIVGSDRETDKERDQSSAHEVTSDL